MQPSLALQAFDGRDLPARGGADRGDARARRCAVDEHGAGAALALAAAVLASREVEIVAQNTEQASLRVRIGLDPFPVDSKFSNLGHRDSLEPPDKSNWGRPNRQALPVAEAAGGAHATAGPTSSFYSQVCWVVA